jgi:superfamily II DNA helicase RecQ
VAAAYDERRQRDQTKLQQMVAYAQTALCRTSALLEALGETGVDQCGPATTVGHGDSARGGGARSRLGRPKDEG